MVEIVGSVAPDEVPEGEVRLGRPGKWVSVATAIVADHAQQRVTVIKLSNDKEVQAMRASLAVLLRKHNLRLRPVLVRQGDEIRVFCEVVARKDGVA